MFKDCKCGERRIPRDWVRCGECQQIRDGVASMHALEAATYRKKVSLRHKLLVGYSAMHPKPVVEKESKPSATSRRNRRVSDAPHYSYDVKEAQRFILRIIEQNRLNRVIHGVRRAQHDMIAPALKEWMEEG